MTAINVIQTQDAICFFSDGAYIDSRNGNLNVAASKVFTNVAGRFAVAVSGSLELARDIRVVSEGAANIEQAVGDLEATLPKILEWNVGAGFGHKAFGIYIGGFSESGERQFWKITGSVSKRTFSVTRCNSDCWFYSPKFDSRWLKEAIGEGRARQFNKGFAERLSIENPIVHGLLALEAQRKHKFTEGELANGTPTYAVGSFAQVTTVMADKIDSYIIKRWPDKIGERITPEGAVKSFRSGFGSVPYVPSRLVGFTGDTDAKSGIDTGDSSNYTLDSANGLVKPTVTAGAQQSNGTAFGDMTAVGGNSAAFDGDTDQINTAAASKSSATEAYVGAAASSAAGIAKAIVYGSNNAGYVGASITPNVTLQLYGKNGTAPTSSTDGTPLGSVTFVDTSDESGTPRTITSSDQGTAYDYRWIRVTQDGSAQNLFVAEVQFYDKATTDNMTVVTTAQTADSSVSHARVLITYSDTDSPTLNTDLTVEVTCDGGDNWTTATLTFAGGAEHQVAETADTECTAGTSFAARIKTLNGKDVSIYGVSLTVH